MCVTLAGNESHPAVADEDKGLTESKGWLRPKMLENIQKSSKTFYFFPKWVTMMDRSELTRRLVSDAQECSRLFTRNWETKQKVLHQRQTAGSYGDNIAQTVMHHVVLCLKNGDSASTRPQNHIQVQHRGSMIECGINLELYKTSRCGIVGDPPRITCFSQGSPTDAHTHAQSMNI